MVTIESAYMAAKDKTLLTWALPKHEKQWNPFDTNKLGNTLILHSPSEE